jgi:hypothetical protein
LELIPRKTNNLIYFAVNILRIKKIGEHVYAGEPILPLSQTAKIALTNPPQALRNSYNSPFTVAGWSGQNSKATPLFTPPLRGLAFLNFKAFAAAMDNSPISPGPLTSATTASTVVSL